MTKRDTWKYPDKPVSYTHLDVYKRQVYLSTLVYNDPLPMFTKRKQDCFKILISRDLMENETKFREYFRVSKNFFNKF